MGSSDTIYFDFDDEKLCWKIQGSKKGINKFCQLLIKYAHNDLNKPISEHQHYGPYLYLKFVTWDEPKITSDAIFGSLDDFIRLSDMIRKSLTKTVPNSSFIICNEYASNAEASILIQITDDEFDPASADEQLTKGNGQSPKGDRGKPK